MKIHKYPLDLIDKQTINLPIDAQILTAQVQNGNIFLWAKVDETAFLEPCDFAIYGTGDPLPFPLGKYIATVQLDGSVCHIFEVFPWPSQC